MRLPSFLRAFVSALLISLSGCGGSDNVEEQQADRDFARVQELLAGGDHRAARSMLAELTNRDRGLGRDARVAEDLHLLASSHAATASFDSAFIFYAAAQEQYKGVADRHAARQVQLQTAALHRRMGEERKAFGLYMEMVRLARVFNDEEGLRSAQWAMLPSCRALGEREEERSILADLFRAPSMTGDPTFAARANLEAGISRMEQNDPDSAIHHLRQAFTLAESSPDSLLASTVLQQLARTYAAAGKTIEALKSYSEALQRSDRVVSGRRIRQELLVRVGNLYLRNRQPIEAARFYRAALTSAINLEDKIGEGYLCIQLGHCEPAGKTESALKYYHSALDLFSNFSHARGTAYALLSIGAVERKLNRIKESIEHLTVSVEQEDLCLGVQDADDVYGEGKRAYFRGHAVSAYDELIDVLLQQGRMENAYHYAGRRRAAVMFHALGSFKPRPTQQSLLAALEGCRRERNLVVGAERQLDAALTSSSRDAQALAEIRETMRSARSRMAEKGTAVAALNPAYRPFVAIESLSLADMHRMLPRGSALVHYVPTRRIMYAFFLSGGHTALEVAAAEQGQTAALASEFLDSIKTLSGANSSRARELSGMLNAIFVRPITNDLARVSKLYVVLPDHMPLVPLHALRGSSTQGAYLAERVLVSYLPSADVLGLPASPPVAVRDVVALGHPGTSDWDVEYELRDIRAFYKDTRLYFGQQATLATLQRERADLLHLAAEFRWDNRYPDNSAVLLPDSRSPEIVRSILLEEILGLPPYPAVVVSNLAPGYTSIHPAEPYLFLANGGRTVIMDGYPPQRKTKKYFGEVFYTALLSGLPACDAFHKAQLDMIRNRDYRSVHTWGAFFLWGR